jgi:hypothetical protein
VYLEMLFEGKLWVCLLDSGCKRSIVLGRMLRAVDLDKCQENLFAANGTKIAVLGETIIESQLGDLRFGSRILVSDHLAEPMLGVDWLRRNEVA